MKSDIITAQRLELLAEQQREEMDYHMSTRMKPSESMVHEEKEVEAAGETGSEKYKTKIVWRNVIALSVYHVFAILGLVQCFTSAQWKTIAFAYGLYLLGSIGVTAGAHRLWSHRSYRAKWPLRLILVVLQSVAYEGSVYWWARDHRVHHKYSDTDADPHNSKRGFFFSHIGWIMSRKHPEVAKRVAQVYTRDLRADPIVMLQHRYYLQSVFLFSFLMPTLVPHLMWAESLYNSFVVCSQLRYVITLHGICLINSVAHMWGERPYDATIRPTQNRLVSFWAAGEGFHNYHHAFPWDYAASELGYELNAAKMFIDFFALFGWAYDRKVVKQKTIQERRLKSGDLKREES